VVINATKREFATDILAFWPKLKKFESGLDPPPAVLDITSPLCRHGTVLSLHERFMSNTDHETSTDILPAQIPYCINRKRHSELEIAEI
jgi:hypothetical protein